MTTRGPLRLLRLSTEWLLKRRAFTHSGGTAPDLHRLPRYAPRGHPRQTAILAQATHPL